MTASSNGKCAADIGIMTLILLSIEVFIALFVHDTFVRPYMGDVLAVIVIYTFVRIFVPEGCVLLPLYVFVFAAGVEVLQLFHMVDLLGLGDNRFFRTLIGSVFDMKDILCYAVGCLILFIITMLRKKYFEKAIKLWYNVMSIHLRL